MLGKASNSPSSGVSRSNDGRLENSPAHREAKLFNACPSLIHIAAEHASDSWASMVRQLGYAHGLRGATSAPLDTLKTIRSNPDGPNFVLGGVNTPSLSALSKVLRTVAARDAPRLTQSKLLFFIGGVRDPLERAVSSYMGFIALRASGELLTPAAWMRAFVRKHPDYQQDSVVPPRAALSLALIHI